MTERDVQALGAILARWPMTPAEAQFVNRVLAEMREWIAAIEQAAQEDEEDDEP